MLVVAKVLNTIHLVSCGDFVGLMVRCGVNHLRVIRVDVVHVGLARVMDFRNGDVPVELFILFTVVALVHK